MDKRWIGIVIILIAGLSCMYLIVCESNTVGSAVSVISDVTVTLPDGYITSEDGRNFCVLFDKQTNETIRVRCLEDVKTHSDEYKSRLDSLTHYDDIIIDKNSTNKNISVIEYENMSSTDKRNITLVFFDKCNHTFSMQLEHFTNETSKENDVKFIIDTLKPDFKQHP
jgi:hypothetical protein